MVFNPWALPLIHLSLYLQHRQRRMFRELADEPTFWSKTFERHPCRLRI
jgi:hypothetical protein